MADKTKNWELEMGWLLNIGMMCDAYEWIMYVICAFYRKYTKLLDRLKHTKFIINNNVGRIVEDTIQKLIIKQTFLKQKNKNILRIFRMIICLYFYWCVIDFPEYIIYAFLCDLCCVAKGYLIVLNN